MLLSHSVSLEDMGGRDEERIWTPSRSSEQSVHTNETWNWIVRKENHETDISGNHEMCLFAACLSLSLPLSVCSSFSFSRRMSSGRREGKAEFGSRFHQDHQIEQRKRGDEREKGNF